MSNMGLGVLLMIVGMISVLLILLIVIYGGELLIKLINRIAPEAVVSASEGGEDPTVRAVLEEAVRQLTGGKGCITNITKIN